MGYTIKQINDDGSVDVTFDYDKLSQNISGLAVDDVETLKQQLSDYEVAYVAGKQVEAVVIDPAVESLIGKPQVD